MDAFEHQLTKTVTERLEYTTFLWWLYLCFTLNVGTVTTTAAAFLSAGKKMFVFGIN